MMLCLPYSAPVTWHFRDLATHRSISVSLYLMFPLCLKCSFLQISVCIILSTPSSLHSKGAFPMSPSLDTQFQMTPSPIHHRHTPCPPMFFCLTPWHLLPTYSKCYFLFNSVSPALKCIFYEVRDLFLLSSLLYP